MQKGTVLNLKRLNSAILFFRNNWCLLTLALIFVLGLVFGSVMLNYNSEFLTFTKSFSKDYLALRLNSDFFTIFKSSLILDLIFLALIFVFGTSVTGVTFVPLIIGVRGVYFGSLAGYIFSQYDLKGIAFNALVLIPPTIITLIFLFLAGKRSINFSVMLIKITLPDSTPRNMSLIFKSYCIYYLFLIIPFVISALLNAWLSKQLIPYLNF